MAQSPAIGSRTAAIAIVAAAHLLVLWAIWRVHPSILEEVETITTQLYFFDAAPRSNAVTPLPAHTSGAAAQPPKSRAVPGADTTATAPRVLLPTPADSSTAITPPPPPAVDWSSQLSGAARTTLEQEQRSARQASALTRRYLPEDDPRNLHPGPVSSFRWSDAATHRFDTRGSLPVLHVNERCVLLLFILPACAIGHIEIHGDLFENAAVVHDEKLATPRPNDVP